MAATVLPAAASTSWSKSTNGRPRRRARRRPTSLFPVAMNPVRITCGTSEAPHVREIAVEVPPDLGERVATELLQERVGDHERDDRLRDDRGGRNRDDVGALDRRLG